MHCMSWSVIDMHQQPETAIADHQLFYILMLHALSQRKLHCMKVSHVCKDTCTLQSTEFLKKCQLCPDVLYFKHDIGQSNEGPPYMPK